MILNKNYNYQQTKFIKSVPNINHLSKDDGIEIAFIGYSNSGKSSALNALTQQKKLARTSKIPGRTQLINLFEVTNGIRLIDLPGYGYTKAPKLISQEWQKTLNEYLQKRICLKGLVILMDIRHPLKNIDIKIIKWSIIKLPILILLTKADKITFYKQKNQIKLVQYKLKKINNNIQIEIFSSFKKIGIDKLKNKLNIWFNENKINFV